MKWWRKFHSLRWYARWPLKSALLCIVVLLVTYPYPHLLVRNVQRWRNPNAMINPGAPELEPLVQELCTMLDASPEAPHTPKQEPRQALKLVEKYVCSRIKYDWDWNVWGVADYLPTVQEVLAKGREDCDGQAVVAASLLRHLGYRAVLVSDFAHVWVKTDAGETMRPGKRKSVLGTEKGVRVNWGAIGNLPRAVAYGISPFPLAREFVVLATLWTLLLRPGVGRSSALLGAALLVLGLLVLRHGGRDWRQPTIWLQCIGLLQVTGGAALMIAMGRRGAGRRGSSAAPPVQG